MRQLSHYKYCVQSAPVRAEGQTAQLQFMRRRKVENGDAMDAGPATTALVTLINPAGLYDPTPYGYSHVAALRADCRIVYIAGQGGENERGELSSDFGTQVRQALSNLQTALKGAGASTADVAKLTVLIVDHTEDKLRLFGSELKEALGRDPSPPAR